MSSAGKLNTVFYADTYHPVQAGSIDGTDIAPHDNAVYRALLCHNARLYDPFGDPKVVGDPYCTVFVGRLSHYTTEDNLLKAMSKYGKVKHLRLVRHIVTGASRGYAFVEYETERDMRRAYEYAHHSIIDDSEIIVDYNRQQLMPGWIPRRLGGGLGGKKESGQLRFGGRERPFRAPLRPIPYDDLKRLGIPPPPEGRYMSRFQIPSPPRRRRSSVDEKDYSDLDDRLQKPRSHRSRSERSVSGDKLSDERKSVDRTNSSRHKSSKHSNRHEKHNQEKYYNERNSVDKKGRSHMYQKRSLNQERSHDQRGSLDMKYRFGKNHESSVSRDLSYIDKSSADERKCFGKRDERSLSQEESYEERQSLDGQGCTYHKYNESYLYSLYDERSSLEKKERSHKHSEKFMSQGESYDERSSVEREERLHKCHERGDYRRQNDKKHISKQHSSYSEGHVDRDEYSRKHHRH